MSFKSEAVANHFNRVAGSYDYWKKKNWYYYDELKRIAAEFAAGARSLLDVGCGTGTITLCQKPPKVVGIDISPEMIEIAKSRNTKPAQYQFFVSDAVSFPTDEKFELIISFDVIEHLPNPAEVVLALKNLLAENGRIVISMANPLWEPILMVAEKLKLKMPEGPHRRISANELIASAEAAGLKLVRLERRLLFPKYIPVVSFIFNSVVGRLPIVRRFCFIELFVFIPQSV
jgi:2-polyprenyl-3-methyl-5-hydroxy-6-metoxy-1,4-benzoquinol methylase